MKCTICNTLFYTNDQLILHVHENHNFLDNLVSYGKCVFCGIGFGQYSLETAKSLMTEHVKNCHVEEKSFEW